MKCIAMIAGGEVTRVSDEEANRKVAAGSHRWASKTEFKQGFVEPRKTKKKRKK